MYLESLELQGFKSFPDKIKLTFDKGLTAVVGPNGSGKSNIGDAVRWVLGEQSSKTLRGSKMEDVIFAGTQYRKPMGFAQVTLNIVNNRGILQIPSEQVSVTRKLYRSGESEYLINGAQVRLKDVYELFMDTGLGRDGYSIIGQGRVAEIVSAKSGERREIFEEAAGISKFRYKKTEAERRLAAAQVNIDRLRDVIAELESRVGPLKIQSEKAKKFLEYSETRKSLEITVWVRQLDDLKKRLEKLEEDLLISTNDYNGVEADMSRLDDEINSIALKIEANDLHTEELRTESDNITASNSQINSDIAVCRNDIAHCNDEIKRIEKQQEIASNSSQVNDELIKQKKSELKAKQDEVKNTIKQREAAAESFNAAVSEHDSFSSIYEDIQSELTALSIRQSEYSVSVSAGEQSLAEIKQSISESKEQDEAIRETAEKLRGDRTEYLDAISKADEEIAGLNNRIGGLEKLRAGRTEKLEAAKSKLDRINFDIVEKEQRIRVLTDLENSMEGFANSVKQVLKASKTGQLRGICGSAAQLIKVEQEYSVAVETALGGAMQNIIVENEDIAKRCIRFLQETKAGRATFLPLTSVKGTRLAEKGLEDCGGFVSIAADLVRFDEKFRGVYTSLLGKIVVAEDLDSATVIAKKYGYKFRIVTLDGQVINAGGSFTGGSVSRSSGVLTRKNEIEKLTAAKNALAADLEAVKKEHEKYKTEADKLGFDIEAAKEEMNVASTDKIHFEAELKSTETLLSQSEEQLKNAQQNSERLIEKLASAEKEIEETKQKLAEISEIIKEKEQKVSENKEKLEEMQEKRESLTGRITELKLRETELSKDAEAIEAEIKQLEAKSLEIGGSTAALAAELEAQKALINEKEERIKELEESRENSKAEIEKLEEMISKAKSERRAMEQRSNEAGAESRQLADRKEKISSEKSRLEERKNSVQSSYDKIIADMSEQYNIYLSEAMELAQPVTDLLMLQRDLADVKQKIRALGSVNVEAIDEYKEVSERYEKMSYQLSDVETSKRELEKHIEELTETMRRRFSESFSQINENFKSIFTELFGGGRAELSLTEPDDVLESGIEIQVAPPGKVIKNLSLLSGGEQAFVAIAIYFSILKLKPAPFCILDEIEAALDEVNVVKYAQYLRHFTDTTQFILVTHRRGSMDEADVLYGVTMQEKGISKVLRVDQAPADTN